LCIVAKDENGAYYGDCEDARGEYREETKNLICTDIDGYSKLERYIDQLELRVRNCGRKCKKEKVTREDQARP